MMPEHDTETVATISLLAAVFRNGDLSPDLSVLPQ
jgi:hypothetical protein